MSSLLWRQDEHPNSPSAVIHRRRLESPRPQESDSHHQPFHPTHHRFSSFPFSVSHQISISISISFLVFSMQGISQQLLRKTLISLSLPPKLPSPATRAPIGPPLPAPFGLATSAPSLPRFLLFHFYSIFALFLISIILPPSLADHREKAWTSKTRSYWLWKTARWSRLGHRNLSHP